MPPLRSYPIAAPHTRGSHRARPPCPLGAADRPWGASPASAGTVMVSSGGYCPRRWRQNVHREWRRGWDGLAGREDAESPRACSAPPSSAARAFLVAIKSCRSSAQAPVDAEQKSPARPRPSPAPLCVAPIWLGARAPAVYPFPARPAACPAGRSFRQPVHNARLSSLASEWARGWKRWLGWRSRRA